MEERLVKLLERLLRRHTVRASHQAVAFERERLTQGQVDLAAVAARLGGPHALPFGHLREEAVHIRLALALQSALIVGASGSGKTRLVIHLVMTLVEWLLEGVVDVEVEVGDLKFETYDELRKRLALLHRSLPEAKRERLARMVRVIDWSRSAVSPFAPFDNAAGLVSDAYLAHVRTEITVQVSPYPYSGSLQQITYMWNRVLVARRFPPNYALACRFFRDRAFRQRILEGVADSDLREFFRDAEVTIPKQTVEALLRRLQFDESFPEIRLSEGIPPSDLDRFRPSSEVRITLGNFGASPESSLPPGKGLERCKHRVADILAAAPRRDRRRPAVLILEEGSRILEAGSDLTEALMWGVRTLRRVGMGIWVTTQDFGGADPQLLRALTTNTWWWAFFRSPGVSDLLFPHLAPDPPDAGRSETERKLGLARHVASLPPRRYLFLAKGHPLLPLTAPTVPDLDAEEEEDLVAAFERDLAARTMIPADAASALIERFTAEVVGRGEVAPSTRATGTASRRVSTLQDLLRELDGSEADPESES